MKGGGAEAVEHVREDVAVRRACWAWVPLAMTLAPALAAEPPAAELFCEGAPAVTAKPAASPGSQIDWRDFEASVLLAVGALGAVVYVVRNEKRRDRALPPINWTPYVAGASLGVVFAISLLVFQRPLGVSAGVQLAARAIEGAVPGGGIAGGGATAPSQSVSWWPLWVLLGVTLGGASSARLRARDSKLVLPLPGANRVRTWMGAFGAGALLQVAAVIAGGCTSGLALSGGIVLAPAAFVFMAGMFIGGIPAASVAARWAAKGAAR